jgi:phage/plasmid-associated DNA primase
VVLVPWGVTISDEQCDPQLLEKLKADGSGILKRMIAGVLSWLSRGLDIPQSITSATAEYRESSDHLARFLAECTRHVPGAAEPATRLYMVYLAWARATGAPLWKQTGFGKAMRERGYRSSKSGTHFWMDIQLVKRESDFESIPDPNKLATSATSSVEDDDDVDL